MAKKSEYDERDEKITQHALECARLVKEQKSNYNWTSNDVQWVGLEVNQHYASLDVVRSGEIETGLVISLGDLRDLRDYLIAADI